ncbi:hypothetical protein OFC41_32095, partial [Escherichia coli]|nr:hypothetical protein [Escherichia coli]
MRDDSHTMTPRGTASPDGPERPDEDGVLGKLPASRPVRRSARRTTAGAASGTKPGGSGTKAAGTGRAQAATT